MTVTVDDSQVKERLAAVRNELRAPPLDRRTGRQVGQQAIRALRRTSRLPDATGSRDRAWRIRQITPRRVTLDTGSLRPYWFIDKRQRQQARRAVADAVPGLVVTAKGGIAERVQRAASGR